MKRGWDCALSIVLVSALATLVGAQETTGTLDLHVVGSRVVTQSTPGISNCGFWTQNGYTWGSCNSSDDDFQWAVNAVETGRMRYLLSCRLRPFHKCGTLTVGSVYEAEQCGGNMCVHVLYGKNRKPTIFKYSIVQTVLH
jgi:hypothetical protein